MNPIPLPKSLNLCDSATLIAAQSTGPHRAGQRMAAGQWEKPTGANPWASKTRHNTVISSFADPPQRRTVLLGTIEVCVAYGFVPAGAVLTTWAVCETTGARI